MARWAERYREQKGILMGSLYQGFALRWVNRRPFGAHIRRHKRGTETGCMMKRSDSNCRALPRAIRPALLAVFLCTLSAGRTNATEWGAVHQKTVAGLALQVDARWVPGGGYRPMKIRVTPVSPVSADRTLHVEFTIHTRDLFGLPPQQIRVERRVEIPADSGPVEEVLSLPPSSADQYEIRIYEGRTDLAKFSQLWSNGSPGDLVGLETTPKLLFVGPKLPDTSKLASVFPDFQDLPGQPYTVPGQPVPTNGPAAVATPLDSAFARTEAELPSRWIDYTSLDIVSLSLDQLARLNKDRPQAFAAILQWTASGGNLLVYPVGNQGQRLPELEQLTGFPKPSGTAKGDCGGWLKFDRADVERARTAAAAVGNNPGAVRPNMPRARVRRQVAIAGGVNPGPASPPGTASPVSPQPAEPPPFLFRPLGMGMVVAFAADPFPGTDRQWWAMRNLFTDSRWDWSQRYGLSMFQDNPDFWKFLIPGVGLAPVVSFEILITLFVLAIGPANYFLLRRWKRLYLLVVTVPLSAALVTLALFGYALVSDGLGTRVRVRSVTEIDPHRGEAVCWARLSYYCGLPPSGGLQFPPDTMVLSYDAFPGEVGHRFREMAWRENQGLQSGWLGSRTPTQFLTVRVRRTELGLKVTPAEDASGGLKVENHLGSRLRYLALRTEKGDFFSADDVPDEGTVAMAPVAARASAAPGSHPQERLQRIWQENEPDYPPGVNAQMTRGAGARSYRYAYYASQSGTAPAQQTNRLEETLAAVTGRVTRKDLADFQPGSFVAVVDQSPEVVLGTPAAREESGFHVMVGKW